MKKLFTLILISLTISATAQSVGINTDGGAAHTSAMLDVSSTTKGFLPPRMTYAQKQLINSPAVGLMVYCTDCSTYGEIQVFNGVAWTNMMGGTATATTNVTIGNQVWSNSNLNVTTYRNGDIIPQVTDPTAWTNLTTGAWCYYNNDSANGTIYGKLYNWYAVNDPRGLAPAGWHIPSDSEWNTLFTSLGSGNDWFFGGRMKTTGTTLWNSPNTGATNDTGFSALPGGRRYNNGASENMNNLGYWWTSTSYLDIYSWFYQLTNTSNALSRTNNLKTCGLSVRCIRD